MPKLNVILNLPEFTVQKVSGYQPRFLMALLVGTVGFEPTTTSTPCS
ncbi:hypothetical protein [Legionella gresilensis]|nr:hypothetical protein [Legionella gresilensis]